MSRSSTHIVLLQSSSSALDALKKSVDNKLMRGTNVMELDPLSELHCTQRLVHSIMSRCDFVPYNREQEVLAEIADKTMGSPDLVGAASALLSQFISTTQECEDNGGSDDESGGGTEFLERFHSEVCCGGDESTSSLVPDDFATRLLKGFSLSECDSFFLSTLSLFGGAPIPRCLVEAIQLLSLSASSELPGGKGPLAHLTDSHLLHVFPSPVIVSPTKPHTDHTPNDSLGQSSVGVAESEFYYVPEVIGDAMRGCMDNNDLAFSFAVAHRALKKLYEERGTNTSLGAFLAGTAKALTDSLEGRNGMEDCYKEVYRTYLLCATADCQST